jgi:hypothetical protein
MKCRQLLTTYYVCVCLCISGGYGYASDRRVSTTLDIHVPMCAEPSAELSAVLPRSPIFQTIGEKSHNQHQHRHCIPSPPLPLVPDPVRLT